MKRILHLSVALFLSSCLIEKNIDPGKPGTFVRYFNGGNNDYAQVAEETLENDIIILATTRIDAPASPADSSKIKLIKTDRYGSTLFQKLYPAFGSTGLTLAGAALLQLPAGGFMVAGTQITVAHRDLYLLHVNDSLRSLEEKKIDFTVPPFNISESVQAKAIQLNKNGNYLVLASVESTTYNMLLVEIDKSTFAINWVNKYGAGTSSLGHKIFLDATSPLPNVYWSGTVTRNSTDIRLVKTAQNSLNTIFDLPIGRPEFIEQGRDICQYGLGFIVVGNSNETNNQDILFKILTNTGSELFSKTVSGDGYGEADTGNAVCATNNGFVVLGSVKKTGQDDYFLMKYDGFGNDVWPKPIIIGNSSRNDTGASIRQLTDGSLLVLGTTVFGGLNTIMLMKADSNGDVQ
jgi:hypothetical protein